MAEVALLPVEQQVDALLQFLSTVLKEMPTGEVRRKRDELMGHFSNCGCSFQTCSALLEMVDHHILIRERWAARQQVEARKAVTTVGPDSRLTRGYAPILTDRDTNLRRSTR